jgi:hypothetical protein
MAKKITNTEEEQNNSTGAAIASENSMQENSTSNEEAVTTGAELPTVTETKPKTESKPATPVQPATEPEKPAAEKHPHFVDALLKTFSSYESLYIDSHGGVYTPDTSEKVRGSAILYKNPYHN